MQKNVLVTGCTSGFGLLTAKKFAENNYKVFACVKTLENNDELENLAIKFPNITILKIDVTDQQDINCAYEEIENQLPNLDILVNNAGYGLSGPFEDISIKEWKDQYEVNIFGYVRVIQKFLPLLKKSNNAKIFNVSSINGLLAFPLNSAYSSSKFAVESFSEILNFEVKPFNIDVIIIEPGAFLTKYSKNSIKASRFLSNTEYSKLKSPLNSSLEEKVRASKFLSYLLNPEHVSNKIWLLSQSKKPGLRYRVGLDCNAYYFLRKILPYSLWLKILRNIYKW